MLTITPVWSVYPRPVIDGMGCQLCRDVLSTYLRQKREHEKLLLFCGRLFYHSKKCTNCKFHSPYWRLWERIHRFRHLQVCKMRWAVAPSPWFLEEQRRSVKLDLKVIEIGWEFYTITWTGILFHKYCKQGKLHDDEFIQIEWTPSGWCILISVNKSKGQINKLVAYNFLLLTFFNLIVLKTLV